MESPAYVIPPVNVPADEYDFTITAAMLDSPIAEPDTSVGEAAYSGGTTYVVGDQVISATTHRTYESLVGSRSVVTISIATPGAVTWPNHGLAPNTPVVLTTTGALPTGLTAGTTYFVHTVPNLNSFTLKATLSGAEISTSGSQSGVHTATANGNLGNDPASTLGLYWTDVGPTNRFKAFDLLRNSRTVAASPFTFTLTPGTGVDAIGFSGISADQITISFSSTLGGGVVRETTMETVRRPVTNWYEWVTAPYYRVGVAADLEIPPYPDIEIEITLTSESGTVELGGVVMGLKSRLGTAVIGSEIDAQNFSPIERDAYGNARMIPQRNTPVVRQTVWCEAVDVNRLNNTKNQLAGVPAYWIFLSDPTHPYFEILVLVGPYSRWTIPLEHHEQVPQRLEVLEV